MKLKQLKGQILTMTFGVMLGRGLGFIQGILIARLMGPAALGIYATLTMVSGLLSRVSDLGLPSATAYYLRRRPGAMGSLLSIAVRHILACTLIAALCTWGVRHSPLSIAKPIAESTLLSAGFFVSVNIGAIANTLPLYLMAAGSYRSYVSYLNILAVLQMALQLAVWGLAGASYRNFFLANVATQIIMASGLAIRLIAQSRRQAHTETLTAREAYGFGIRSHWGVLMKLANTQMEVPLLGTILAPAEVGRYSVGASLREATLIPQAFYAGILQNMLVDRNKKSGKEGGLLVLKCMVLQGAFSGLLVLGALAVLPVAVPIIYGPAFARAVPVVLLLVCAALFTGLSALCWTDFHAKGKPHLTSATQTLSGLLGPLFLFAFSKRFGLVGAGIASVIAAFVTFSISIYFVFRLNALKPSDVWRSIREARTFVQTALHRKGRAAPVPASAGEPTV